MTDRDITERLDPALRHLAGARTDLSPPVLGAVRDSLNQRRAETARSVDTVGVEIEQREVPVPAGHRVTVRIYRGGPPGSGVVLYCHSGAFVLGTLDTDHRQCIEMARRGRCTVLSVDYRLAPEHPYPAALDDAAAILDWGVGNAAELGIDAAAVALAGSSAGASLVAGLAQRSAAGGAPPVVFQLLHQPVLDDRPSPSKEEFTTTPGFDSQAVQWMWRHYGGGDPLPEDAVPARADELSELPATLITCSELDPLRDEAIDYALRLMWSGVNTELHVFSGTCHGFDSLVPDWEVSSQLFDIQGAALRRAFLG
ncbi:MULTISPECIES: alpha/beta hydrolase [Mycolicibacterium]|uniref:Alpha/beta hydrolase n=1 Tax=Mycolicibacterium austroafricanum TaxID=39687 RepID=A0ABT8HAI9_MYCAO|nr:MULTISPECIES: alpha/beta hydrolase [Mycolicibacterium]MDN4517778.1 alpha/beta hydrolase [Mycolicibacterium austroafricanum]PQP43926.1 alpha/beta hydrolase [Mycolicibacterium austroafricanum]QRZ08837.1 alpha/beta hydrolase [Mycolicibacterium austroafricanum]QZT59038.1 alpha/beta hydrolase [Mycolicibacterium austroafricanum]QZT70612.1 alpha/beta hydrolase [Mycolicibacterium austroafricanum]